MIIFKVQPDPAMSHKIKIFIASSKELKEERKECIFTINHLNKSHDHFHLEAIEWEYDVSSGNFPGYAGIQEGINPKLEESDVVVFLFYSRIGKYTLEEFELATLKQKKIFVFFKEGFSPKNAKDIAAYSELLAFKESLDGILPVVYSDINSFKAGFYPELNGYLAANYKSTVRQDESQNNRLSESLAASVQLLTEKEKEIKELKERIKELPEAGSPVKITRLEQEIASIRNELSQSEELKSQLANDKAVLEQQLSAQKEKEDLKAKALEAVEKGDYAKAEIHLKQSAQESISETATTFYELAKIKKLQLQFPEALEYYELAANIDRENHFYLSEAGLMATDMGFYDKAIAYYNKALSISTSQFGEENQDIVAYYNNLGMSYASKGAYKEAIKYYKKALNINRKYYGEEHVKIAILYNNLGSTYWNVKEYDKAIDYYEKALFIDKKCHGDEHSNIATRYNNLGSAYRSKGVYDKAIDYCYKALNIILKYHGEEHPKIGACYNNLGSVHRARGEYDKAIDYYKKGLIIDKKHYGEKHPSIATRYNNLGTVYEDKGQYILAIDYYKKSLLILQEFLPEDHPNMITLKGNLNGAIKAYEEDTNENGPVTD